MGGLIVYLCAGQIIRIDSPETDMSELDNQIAFRRQKRDQLAATGVLPYPHRFDHDLEASDVHARYGEQSAEALEQLALRLRVPGRLISIRRQGKVVFADLHDGRNKLQLFIRQNNLSAQDWERVLLFDLGDFIGAEGLLMRTKMGELSLAPDKLTFLAKALRPLPEKWSGLKDVELRYRQRYVDLLANEASRRVFEVRARIVRGIRRYLDERGFLEVETPMMQPIPGGAAARPFKTHHNTLDLDLYLRIAPELYLKRLLVGGMPKVYEINRNFRNEGISTQHNPEFTMLEFYWAYADYRDLITLTEELVSGLAQEVLGGQEATFKGQTIRFERPWACYTMKEATEQLGGVDAAALADAASLEAELRRRHLALPPSRNYGSLLLALFEQTVEERLIQPTFITDHPTDISPLSKQRQDDPSFTERFELYIAGMELANAFSELNDPDLQADRFRQQLAMGEEGDEEAHRFDADYIRALEFGMPPAAGQGIGIDRLTMIFTDSASIRDVILFPLLRPLAAGRTLDVEEADAEEADPVVAEVAAAIDDEAP
jgi:lysyl-tRNA synthetase class 2